MYESVRDCVCVRSHVCVHVCVLVDFVSVSHTLEWQKPKLYAREVVCPCTREYTLVVTMHTPVPPTHMLCRTDWSGKPKLVFVDACRSEEAAKQEVKGSMLPRTGATESF